MKHKLLFLYFFSALSFSNILLAPTSRAALISTHIIQFGGIFGTNYSPNSLNVLVGDTIKWIGDFTTYPMQSTSVPIGALAFGTISSGDTFTYIVKIAGEYDFQNNIYASIGLAGSFIAAIPHNGLTNEGCEFYLGMLNVSYNSVATSSVIADFNVFAFISTHYENDVNVSYYDATGAESTPQNYHILRGNSLKLKLNYPLMQMDTASDVPSKKSCHITSHYPVTIYYISVGACAGGSYLALPVISLGKNYVAASYNDNPINGSTEGNNNYYYPKLYDYAGGEFMVIGTEDLTNVKITPMTTTVTGHPGANTGVPHPYSIQLNKGQCYLVRSNGRNEDNDMSGSLIESSSPVAVISGHENAILGGTDPYNNSIEARDFMVEQMVPVEYWDSLGYISVPFVEPSPPGTEGHGDTYRIYVFDSTTVQAHLDVQGVSGGYDMTTRSLVAPPDKIDVTAPVEAYSTNGKKIALMQYDERSQTTNPPWPAPSMMTIVPKSRWKSSYDFSVPNGTILNAGVLEYVYINVIASNFGNIALSVDGANPTLLTSLSRVGQFSNFSNNFPDLKAYQYKFESTSGLATNYSLSSTQPFVVYYYGMRDFTINSGYIGDPTHVNFFHEYAAPAGMQLNTGVIPSFSITVDTTSNCSGWHICVRDTGTNDPGLKAVILIDDPDGVYWQQPGAKYSNVSFDSTSTDFYDGELHPHFHSPESYCFDVNFGSPLAAASAPLAIVDNLGNAVILRLDRNASALKLSTNPPTSSRADSIVFPVEKIGQGICTTFVFKNSAPAGGTPVNLTSAGFTNNDTSYKIQAINPSLPHSVVAGDSLTLQVCYTPQDSSRHRDTLLMQTDCFSLPVSLDAHGSTGLISAPDLDFSSVITGNTLCKTIQIKNVGTAAFMLTGLVLSDSLNFSASSSTLPVQLKPGNFIAMSICFHPQTQGSYTAGIDWTTDLESSFAHSIKSHTALSGIATPKAGVAADVAATSFSIHPNPSNGNSVIVTFGFNEKATLSMYDVLGREVYHQDILSGISEIQIPIRNLSEGVYYVQLATSSVTISQKFMKIK